MYKIINRKTGSFYYFNAKETAKFLNKNGEDKYRVETIKEFNLEQLCYKAFAILMMSTLTLLFIYFATS